MAKTEEKNKNDYKVIISELGVDPFHMINIVFSLMCIIPLLTVVYIIVDKRFIYDLFLNENGIEMVISIFIAILGLLYAYKLVTSLVEKLSKYAEEGRIANNEKAEVLIAVGSDLKAPLTVLKAGMSRLMDPAAGALKGDSAETARSCFNAAEAMHEVIEKFTNFSKAGFIRMGIKREFIDLQDMIKTELDSVEQLIKKNNLNLQCSFAAANTNMWGDRKKLSRAITGLLSNAVKYTPEGSAVKITVLSDENTVQFSVNNTGPGLLFDKMDRIFEKSESPDSHSGKIDMTADLSIVKEIVDLHNGHITVSSAPDKEVEFKIVLPRDLRMRMGMQEFVPEAADKAELAADGAMRIAEIVNQNLQKVIGFYKADASSMRLRREYIEILPLLDETIASYKMRLSEKQITFKKYIPQVVGSLWADRNKLTEIMSNLLSNAVERTPSCGTITVKLTGNEDEICFEVSDAGTGIAKENIEKLFEKPEGVTEKNIEDATSNLPMTKNIVDLHGGKIWVESELGKGSRFFLTLPRDLRKGRDRPVSLE